MSERLADIGRRIATVRQLNTVVNAMRGIAAARAQQSRALLPAIRAYAEVAARSIAQARRLEGGGSPEPPPLTGKPALIVFGAEQGFAGAYAEQVLDAVLGDSEITSVFLLGSRTATLVSERRLPLHWHASFPSRASAIPNLATLIVDAIYEYLSQQGAVSVALVHAAWSADHGVSVLRRNLLPFDASHFPPKGPGKTPLTNLPAGELIQRLGEEFVFGQVCEAAAEAFAAENEARVATMAAAKTNIDGKLVALESEERLTRQDEITAEVVELAAGGRGRFRT